MAENSSGHSSDSSLTRTSRERRNCLKRALQQTQVLQEIVNDSTVNILDQVINEADHVAHETSIQEKILNREEVVIDSEMMWTSSKVLKTCTISLTKRMHDYDYIDFAEKLKKCLEELSGESQPLNWSLLEEQVTKVFRRIPDYNTLLGTLQPLEKKTVIRKRPEPRLPQQTEMKIPDKIVPNLNSKDEDSIERIVRKIRKLIATYYKENHKSLDFFQLVLHPHDFGKTVRNILYVSFLVKDGVVNLKKENNNLMVQPCRATKEGNTRERRSNKRTGIQSVISLNMKQWTILKDAYKIEEPMIDFEDEQ